MLNRPLTSGDETVQAATVDLTDDTKVWISRQLRTLRSHGWVEEERPWATTDGSVAYLELISTSTSTTSLTTQDGF
jgi:hypothetical protein